MMAGIRESVTRHAFSKACFKKPYFFRTNWPSTINAPLAGDRKTV